MKDRLFFKLEKQDEYEVSGVLEADRAIALKGKSSAKDFRKTFNAIKEVMGKGQ